MDRRGSSPRLSRLREAVAEHGREALEGFWGEVSRDGAPLVEPLDGPGGEFLVTLLWRADGPVDDVWVVGGPGCIGLDRMDRLAGTDVFFATYVLPADTRCTYQFLQTPPPWRPRGWGSMLELLARSRPDPLNPKQVTLAAEAGSPTPDGVTSSVLELPAAPPQPWVPLRDGVASGAVHLAWVGSRILGNDRRVWVYTPPGYDPEGPPYPWMVAFDGTQLVDPAVALPTTLDNLVEAGAVPPLVVAMVDNPSPDARCRELPCSEPFVEFLAEELVPALHAGWHLSADPARAVVAGASFGGLAALFAALRLPQLFANVISQSGAFWWSPPGESPEWLTRQVASSPAVPKQAWLDVGLLERGPAPNGGPDPVEANRRLRDALAARGTRVHHVEFSGNHHPICWRGTRADALVSLTAAWDRAPVAGAGVP